MRNDRAFRFSVAPMMEWTDSFCRLFHRAMTREARLYTEMVTAAALIHGPRRRLLAFEPQEQPLALQIGGADARELALAARFGEEAGYREINLNVGCPSDRVQNGRFGACLMREPGLVGDCVAAMKAAVAIPVTVKCRLGVDEQDTPASARAFEASFGVGYPSVNDSGSQVTLDYSSVVPISGTPTTVVIDRSGRVGGAIFGSANYTELSTILNRLTGRGAA